MNPFDSIALPAWTSDSKSFPSGDNLWSDFSKDDGGTTDDYWDKHPLGQGLDFSASNALQSPTGSAANQAQQSKSAIDSLKQAHEAATGIFGATKPRENVNHLADMHKALQEFGTEGLSLPDSSDVKVKYNAHGRPFTTVDLGAKPDDGSRSSPFESMSFGVSPQRKASLNQDFRTRDTANLN